MKALRMTKWAPPPRQTKQRKNAYTLRIRGRFPHHLTTKKARSQ